jgi:glucose-1-phosphate thymidylyltransferase
LVVSLKGIILAGGNGSRLWPITSVFSKQLLPIYNKPMIYYPLSILMLASIRDILIITSPRDQFMFHSLLGNGEELGLKIQYAIQIEPKGIAEAFLIGEKFIGNDEVCLILGDNIFYGSGLRKLLLEVSNKKLNNEAIIFAYYVDNPESYGIVELESDNIVKSIEEKPLEPKSNYCITGLYFYGNEVVEIAKSLKPSSRGELEISDVNKKYLDYHKITPVILGRGYSWFDTGTAGSLLDSSNFVRIIETHHNTLIAGLEEISYLNKWISKEALIKLAVKHENSSYGKQLMKISMEKDIQ